MSTALLRVALLLLMFPSAASAQLRIGSIDVTLRAQKGATLERLRSDFDVDSIKISDEDSWMVHNRPGLPFVVWGTVRFERSRVALISRVWTPDASDISQPDAMRATIGALQALLVNRQANCRIVDRSSRSPGYESALVQALCGLHSVALSVSRIDGKDSFTITEFLGSETGLPPE